MSDIKKNLVKAILKEKLSTLHCYKNVSSDWLKERADGLLKINRVWLHNVINLQPAERTADQLYLSEKNLKNC